MKTQKTRPSAATEGRAKTIEQPASHSKSFYNHRGQLAGHLKNGVFTTHRDPQKHRLRKRNAWCFDGPIVAGLREAGAHTLRVECPDGTVYQTPLAYFDEHAFDLTYDGYQRGLPLRRWTKLPAAQLELFSGAVA